MCMSLCRQEYQQWACSALYLPRSQELGGCGGDLKILCSHLLNAIMDQQLGRVFTEEVLMWNEYND